MSNVFDQLNGIEDGYEENLGGIFSKIKKGIKKAVKKVRRVTSKVGRKVLPSSIRKIGRKLDESGITKLAAGAALVMIGGPAIAAGLKGSKVAGIAGKAIATAKSGIGTIKGASIIKSAGGAAKIIKGGAGLYATTQGVKLQQAQAQAQIKAQQQAADQAEYDAKVAIELSKAMGQSPEFKAAVSQLRAQGYSDDAILQHWVESKSYYQAAVPQVAKTIYPQVLSVTRQSGFSGQTAQDIAYAESYKIADNEVKKAQSSASNNLTPLLIAAGAALLLKI